MTDRPSAGVRLEVALLESDHAVPLSVSHEAGAHRTVLVVSAEADLCRYVRECLRDRADVSVRDAATVDSAVRLAADGPLLIVDQRERAVIDSLPHLRAILIVDDVAAISVTPQTRLLERPFTADGLLAEVRALSDFVADGGAGGISA